MTDLVENFEAHRAHLRAVAYRMLGSRAEADDAVQEAWLRLTRADSAAVDNLGGWLTTVVARVALDMLRARRTRATPIEQAPSDAPAPDRDLLLADAIGPALILVLEALKPAERVAFVLHDMFDLSFEEIAGILGRSPVAVRQLASRARRRVQVEPRGEIDSARDRRVVDAFLAASRDGDFPALVAVLSEDAVLDADPAAVEEAAKNRWGAAPLPRRARGRDAVAHALLGRARGLRRATVDGDPGAVWIALGALRSAFLFTVEGENVCSVELVVEPSRLGQMAVELLD